MIALAITLVLLGLAPGDARAETEPWAERIQLSASVGYEYDDNVNDPTIDTAGGQGASAGVFEAGFVLDAIQHETYDVDLGYDFYESIYAEDDLDELDLRLHLPWAVITRRFEAVDLDFEWRASFGELGGERYLDTHAFGPSISTLVGRSLYLSAGYLYEYRDARRGHPLVTPTNDRTAHRNTLRADALWFLPEAGITIGGGLFFRAEDATEVQRFDFNAIGGRASFVWATPIAGIGYGPLELALRVRHSARRFAGDSLVAPGDGRRRDDRTSVSVALELPLYEYLFGRLTYEHYDSDSNEAAADFKSNVARLQIEARY